ncbi:MAG TPA: hypothetical protein VMB51_09110 [Solirubrobacteraceae bacterium]|nr:hypothetical protein [Solirubrobacteraceae bacterium]
MSAATLSEGATVRVRSDRWASALGALLSLLLVAAAAEIVLDGALGHSPLIPLSPDIAGWLRGIGERLGYRVFLIALLVSTGAYAGLIGLAARSAQRARTPAISARAAIALVAALQLIVFAGPVLLSTDVFSYIAYARMGVEHGLNPYQHGPVAIVGDPVFRYVGEDWIHVATAYGPLYTLLSYPLAPLGLVGALWAMKLEALLASAGTLALTWRCARARGFDPPFALLAVGANPLYVIYGLGGAHNDLIMLALMMAAVALTIAPPVRARIAARAEAIGTPVRTRISGRAEADDRSSPARLAGAGAAVIAGALVKATVAVLLPFMLADRRRARQGRLAILAGGLAALVLGLLAGYLAFGSHGVNLIAALNRDSAFVSTDSFPNELAHLFGKPGVFPVDHDLLKAALALIVVYLLWRTWHGYDWVAASGWALLAISVTSTWLLAWYILWPLPLAVVARDRRLLLATLFVQGLFVIHQTSPLLAPVQ